MRCKLQRMAQRSGRRRHATAARALATWGDTAFVLRLSGPSSRGLEAEYPDACIAWLAPHPRFRNLWRAERGASTRRARRDPHVKVSEASHRHLSSGYEVFSRFGVLDPRTDIRRRGNWISPLWVSFFGACVPGSAVWVEIQPLPKSLRAVIVVGVGHPCLPERATIRAGVNGRPCSLRALAINRLNCRRRAGGRKFL